ncbi:MAG: ArsA family ATPase [Chloroflexi bacterium]|nr:ArsA family ATPase [Chloroflexota bacterium]
MRIILYTGKGGVGKTSVAAATALRASECGYRTVVVSTDPAHSLADSFDIPLGAEPVAVAPNLWGQEVDVLRELEVHWKTVRDWLVALMRWQDANDLVAEEVAILPGMEELVGLLYISRYAESSDYDLVIVDCAPTGETLRLLSFPEAARWYMERLFPIERKLARAFGPLARRTLGIPVPGMDVFNSVESLFHQLEKMRALLGDVKTSSVRLVVNPEKMVIKETQRTFTYLNLYGYATDLVVCNRVLPTMVEDAFFDSWKESQARHLQLIKECFDPIPIFQVPLINREVVGLDALGEMARALFDTRDPTQWFYTGQAQQLTKRGGVYTMKIPIPFTALEDISIVRNGADLVVQVGHHRRNIILPHTLAALPVTDAKKEGENLKLAFHDPSYESRGKRGKGGKKQ